MALSNYMTDPFAVGINEGSDRKHIPFKVYAKVVPSHRDGKRGVYMRNLERISYLVEDDLEGTGLFTLATPVAFTPQVGRSPARLTIYGFIDVDRTISPNNSPTTLKSEIHSGTDPGQATSVRTGPSGGAVSHGQDVKARIDSEVYWLKTTLETSSDWLDGIFFIEYNGMKYGSEYKRKFRSFPIS
jgi:hypothetical protein